MKFKDKNYLISGATSGIGRHLTISLINQGAKVIAIGRSLAKFEEIKTEIDFKENLIILEKDLSANLSDLGPIIREYVKIHGKLNGCVLSAGVQKIKPLKATDEEFINEQFKINVNSSLILAKIFSDKRVCDKDNSSIVFISSIAASAGYKGLSTYSASKGAIISLAKTLAVELAPIRVNSISPGFIKTPMNSDNNLYNEEYLNKLNNEYPLGIGSIKNITPLIEFLLSSSASWITGTNIPVDGGASLINP